MNKLMLAKNIFYATFAKRCCSTRPLNTNYTQKYKPLKTEITVYNTNYEVEKSDVTYLSGVPTEQMHDRLIRIFRPTRNTMQSGSDNTHIWKLEWDNQQRWENPCIGWTSSADPYSNIAGTLEFATKEAAIEYCNQNKWNYILEESIPRKIIPKSYGKNFAWNKRTRTSTK